MRYRQILLYFFLTLIFSSVSLPEENLIVPDYGGEKMQYTIQYGLLNVGEAIISFTADSSDCGGYLQALARSTGIVRLFKSIDYRFKSCMDSITGLPKYASENLADRRHQAQNEFLFDQHSRNDSSIVHSQKSGMHVVPKNMYDLLTAYFSFRANYISECIETGQEVVIKIFISDVVWDLKIKYVGKETIKTLYGRIECLKFNPSTVAGNFFKNEDDMTFWLTDDVNHIPVRIQLDLIIGSLIANLKEYQEPK